MNAKPLVILGMVVGSAVGGFIPSLWGEGSFSLTSVLMSGVGGMIGIWLGWKIAQQL